MSTKYPLSLFRPVFLQSLINITSQAKNRPLAPTTVWFRHTTVWQNKHQRGSSFFISTPSPPALIRSLDSIFRAPGWWCVNQLTTKPSRNSFPTTSPLTQIRWKSSIIRWKFSPQHWTVFHESRLLFSAFFLCLYFCLLSDFYHLRVHYQHMAKQPDCSNGPRWLQPVHPYR